MTDNDEYDDEYDDNDRYYVDLIMLIIKIMTLMMMMMITMMTMLMMVINMLFQIGIIIMKYRSMMFGLCRYVCYGH